MKYNLKGNLKYHENIGTLKSGLAIYICGIPAGEALLRGINIVPRMGKSFGVSLQLKDSHLYFYQSLDKKYFLKIFFSCKYIFFWWFLLKLKTYFLFINVSHLKCNNT